MSEKDIAWAWDDPLAKIPGETARGLSAFHDYVALGAGRSLPLLTKGYRNELLEDHVLYPFFERFRVSNDGKSREKPPSRRQPTLELWSTHNHWQDRLARILEIRAAQRETTRLQRLKELEDSDWQQGQVLRDKVADLLAEMEKFSTTRVQETIGSDGERLKIITLKFKPSLSQMSMAAKIASELQRLSVGAATQNSRLVDKSGEDRDLPVMGIEIVAPPPIANEI